MGDPNQPDSLIGSFRTIYDKFWDLHPRVKRNITLGICIFFILAINLLYFKQINEKSKPPETIHGKRVLVTGAAGFIGFHLSKQLLGYGNTVVGLDSFNDYYDQELKRVRANQLVHDYQIEVVEGNICDKELLLSMFKKHKFTHIAHLAAQAGVRYSLQNPQSYVTNNLLCTTTLLEVVRELNPEIVFVYASSSSVYGRNKKVPFSEKDPVDHPSNIYGASKRANEQWALVYHELFGIKMTGLRFFTVYGPFGRPDMAIYLWANAISKDEPIPLYEKKDSFGKDIVLMRDFTYIDDIVDGIIGSLSLGADLEIFNLGNNTPEPIVNLIKYLGKELGRSEPKQQLKPLPPADITMTFADISHAKKRLGFSPRTKLADGVRKFVSWYRDYYFPDNILYLYMKNGEEFKQWFLRTGDKKPHNTHIYILHDSNFPQKIINQYTKINLRFREINDSSKYAIAKKISELTQNMVNAVPRSDWNIKRVVAYFDSSKYSTLFTHQSLFNLDNGLVIMKGKYEDTSGCQVDPLSASISTDQIAGNPSTLLELLHHATLSTDCIDARLINALGQNSLFKNQVKIV